MPTSGFDFGLATSNRDMRFPLDGGKDHPWTNKATATAIIDVNDLQMIWSDRILYVLKFVRFYIEIN